MSHLCEQSYRVLDSKIWNLRESQHLEHSELNVNSVVFESNYLTKIIKRKHRICKKLFSFWKYINLLDIKLNTDLEVSILQLPEK